MSTATLPPPTEQDFFAGEEYRIFGPPGTGKTTYLKRQIGHAADKFGQAGVMVTSFSRTAARELVSRDLSIPDEQVGTLHAHCYRALNKPRLAESHLKDWNTRHPEYAIKTSDKSESDLNNAIDAGLDDARPAAGAAPGDELLSQTTSLRARCIDRDLWPAQAQRFQQVWERWKRDANLCDFTDLIEKCRDDFRIPPGSPRAIFVDEAQDLNRLQMTLLRQWGSHTDRFIVVGDDDQLLYSFTGAAVEALIEPRLPAEQIRVLKRSWRVPSHVHALANDWIGKCSQRQPKEYLPREGDPGSVARLQANLKNPAPLADHIGETLVKLPGSGRVMVLASCGYMLLGLAKELRERGIPFGNPYRPENGSWNPMGGSGMTAARRALALLKPMRESATPWSVGDLRAWTDWMASKGILRRGAKADLKDLQPEIRVTEERLNKTFEPAALDELLNLLEKRPIDLLRWWQANVHTRHENTTEYVCRITEQYGEEALEEAPRVVIGTIHSVKGGEADVVYLAPDLSMAGHAEWITGGTRRDSVRRLFYVGMTRTRDRLNLLAPSPGPAVSLN